MVLMLAILNESPRVAVYNMHMQPLLYNMFSIKFSDFTNLIICEKRQYDVVSKPVIASDKEMHTSLAVFLACCTCHDVQHQKSCSPFQSIHCPTSVGINAQLLIS
ncbi:conserved hypothetical protein [Trichinella spiralis]|uniref:hypothetical protein n=1 Tax=Trichinella spiralis TaxID=6334 RepID=UPI0001EFC76A|nr:conserved hypothetical protein [Trichinella spiralis]